MIGFLIIAVATILFMVLVTVFLDVVAGEAKSLKSIEGLFKKYTRSLRGQLKMLKYLLKKSKNIEYIMKEEAIEKAKKLMKSNSIMYIEWEYSDFTKYKIYQMSKGSYCLEKLGYYWINSDKYTINSDITYILNTMHEHCIKYLTDK